MSIKVNHHDLAAGVLGLVFGIGILFVNPVFATPYAGDYTYLGEFDPTAGEASSLYHVNLPTGAFSDWWVFDLDPAGMASINTVFLPTTDISNFGFTLYDVTFSTCTSVGSVCAGITLGSILGSSVTPLDYVTNIEFTPLNVGTYAFNITGTVVNTTGIPTKLYSGNLTTGPTPVPEPTTLALLGTGLLFSTVANRRRRKGAKAA